MVFSIFTNKFGSNEYSQSHRKNIHVRIVYIQVTNSCKFLYTRIVPNSNLNRGQFLSEPLQNIPVELNTDWG